MSAMNMRDKAIAWALALGAVVAMGAALSAPADAQTYGNGFKLARFKIEVKGWQTNVQQHHHLAENECDVDDFSSGSERVVFRSPKPIVISAYYMPGQDNPEFFGGKRVAIPTKATVKRSYTPRIGSSPDHCAVSEGDGSGAAQVPDCGTKTVSPYEVKLEYAATREDRDKLLLTTYSSDGDPFERCPGAGAASFPFLTVENTKSDWIGARLSQKELFDPHFRKWISIARGTQRVSYGDWWTKSQIEWEVSFTRLKNKVPGAVPGT
jgi:hypothetical protein